MAKEGSSDYKKIRKREFLRTEWFFVKAKMASL